MKGIHLVIHFVAPALLYMGILLYFICALSFYAAFSVDPSFLVVGLIAFVLGYNSWMFGMRAKEER